MGKKIFVSYKYADSSVENLNYYSNSTVRDYVDKLEKILERDNIYKGEHNDEDQSKFEENTIWEHLKSKIFDSSVTIVLISKKMKDLFLKENEQWIYQEISYSLKELTRTSQNGSKENKSLSNAIICIVLPDTMGSYSYYINQQYYSITYNTNVTFKIIEKNMNNKKGYYNNDSYIVTVKWSDFVSYPSKYIDLAVDHQNNITDYDITKEI